MKERRQNLAMQHIRAEFLPETIDKEKRTVEVVWTTGAKVRRSPWFGEAYDEELSLNTEHVRLDFLNSGKAPFLRVHGQWSLEDVLGVVERAWLTKTDGRATVRFSDRPSLAEVWRDVENGILKGISVGYRVHTFERQPLPEGEKVPTYLAVDWEPKEISLVPIGADAGAGVRSNDDRSWECVLINNIAEAGEEERNMKIDKEKETPAVQSAAPAVVTPDSESIRNEAVAQERKRSSEIRTITKKMGLEESFAERMVAEGHDLTKVRELVIDAMAEKSAKSEIRSANPAITPGQDSSDKFRTGASEWLVLRAGSGVAAAVEKQTGKKVEAGEFRGLTLVDIAREALTRAGVNVRGMDKMALVGMALTQRSVGMQATSDFGVLLENTLHKVLLAAYGITPDTWSRFCKKGSVADFRAHPRYRRGHFGRLDKIGQSGEFKNKSIADGSKESVTAETFGNIIALTRQAIVNDDMGAFSDLAMQLGRAAKLSIEVDVYALLALNAGLGPTMSDGLTMFHANHKNIGAGTALGVAGIDIDRVVLASQTDPSGNEILDLRPKALVLPIGLGGDARVINEAQYDVDTANKLQKPNKVRGLFQDIVDTARLTGTRRYLFADPSIAPAIEVAFLDGQENPFLESEQGFRMDGVEWKVRLDYGVAGIDFRGGVTNAGV